MSSQASHSSGRSSDGTNDDHRDIEAMLQFPSPFEFPGHLPVTLVELRMRQFSGKIRQKANWWEKVHDADIVSKWRREMTEQDHILVDQYWGGEERYNPGDGEKLWPRDEITPAQLDYVFDELRYDACQLQQGLAFYVSTADTLLSCGILMSVYSIALCSPYGVRI